MKKVAKNILTGISSIFLLIYLVFPFFWLIISSVKLPVEMFQSPPTWLPENVSFRYYKELLTTDSFTSSLWNSLLFATFTTVLCLIVGTLGAYTFSRLRFPGKKQLFLLILCTQMLPQMALLIPLFILMRTTGLLYTHIGLILAYVTFSLPYVIWMFRAFVTTVPYDIEEAARIDGCTRIEAVIRMVVPLSLAGFVTTGIFVFIGAWNEFVFASVFTDSSLKTVPLRIGEMIGQAGVQYELILPAGVIASLPVILLVMIFQRYIIQGLTDGGFK
ncbi:carbohydrate ABC transporter permease [Gracilibacillus sp. HCP3S3_G5_1]|uniref:carbohydrate ABC transporter permease n=1 Tax=unclassified Gracilibacillus TaxID=2625209 RepID=UPI003F8B3CF5